MDDSIETVDLERFDALFHATQLIVRGGGRALDDGMVLDNRRDQLAWITVAFEVADAWEDLDAEDRQTWLDRHEGCGCPDALRHLLATIASPRRRTTAARPERRERAGVPDILDRPAERRAGA